MMKEYRPLMQQPDDDDSPPDLHPHAYSPETSPLPQNLDVFFSQIYRYYHGKGLHSIALAGLLNCLALAFTVASSALCLLFIDWSRLNAPCIVEDSCDIFPTILFKNPLASRGVLTDVLLLTYLSIFLLFLIWTVCHYAFETSSMIGISWFMKETLGISDRHLSVMTWAEVVSRLVILQETRRLSITRTLDEHDIVSRIMRKENYMIALVNSGILSTSITLPTWLSLSNPLGALGSKNGSRLSRSDRGRRKLETLTRTIEWNIKWCLLDEMFDERFEIKAGFTSDPERLAKGMFRAGVVNLLLSPFLVVFLFIYFFMHNAERFYSHPGAISTRRWTSLAKWRMRELNELPHYLSLRLCAARGPADKYLGQFPSPTMTSLARFVSFVAGSLAALVLMVTLMDEKLLERNLLGRHLVWWLAFLGVILAASRSMAGDGEDVAPYDPEGALQELAAFTHWMPRHWRGRAHEKQVQGELSSMYQLKVWTFIEEMASVLLTPVLLMWVLPKRAQMITEFIGSCTVKVQGVGDVCSYATFNLERHGNVKYGSTPYEGLVSTVIRPTSLKASSWSSAAAGYDGGQSQGQDATQSHAKAKQGKVEKSLITFASTYPTWQPSGDSSVMQQVAAMEGMHMHAEESDGLRFTTTRGDEFLNSNESRIQGWRGSRSAHVAIDMPSSTFFSPLEAGRMLPINEGDDLATILKRRHCVLSQLYVTNDPTVQHRMHHSRAQRSVHISGSSHSGRSSAFFSPDKGSKSVMVNSGSNISSNAASSVASQSQPHQTPAIFFSGQPIRLPLEEIRIDSGPAVSLSANEATTNTTLKTKQYGTPPLSSDAKPPTRTPPAVQSIEMMEADPNPLLGFCP